MTLDPDDRVLTTTLPGVWQIGATNFPMWVTGERIAPSFRYEILAKHPLKLCDTVTWLTPAGETRSIRGVDTWKENGFRWRGRKLLSLVSSRWSVASIDRAGTIAVIRFTRTRVTPAGIDIVIRKDETVTPEGMRAVRATVAADPESFGVSTEEFAGLTWLDFSAQTGAAHTDVPETAVPETAVPQTLTAPEAP
jgi:hypothetical protein